MIKLRLTFIFFTAFLLCINSLAQVSYIEYRVKASKKNLSSLKSDRYRLEALSTLLDKKAFIKTSNNYLLGDNKNSYYKKGIDSIFMDEIHNELALLRSYSSFIQSLPSSRLEECENFKTQLLILADAVADSAETILSTSDEVLKLREFIRLKLLSLNYSSLEELNDLSYDFYSWGQECFCHSEESQNIVTQQLSSLQKLTHYFLGVNGSWDVFPLATGIGVYAKKELDEALDDLIKVTPLVIAGVALFELYFIPQVGALMSKVGVSTGVKTFLSIATQVSTYAIGAYYLYEGFEPLVSSYLKMNDSENIKQTYKNIDMILNELPRDNYNLYSLIYKIEEQEHINHVKNTPKKLKEKIMDRVIDDYGSEKEAHRSVKMKLNFLESYISKRSYRMCSTPKP